MQYRPGLRADALSTSPAKVIIRSILTTMRIVIMLVSILIISLLIFKGFSGRVGGQAAEQQMDAYQKAGEVNQIVQDAANKQRQEIKKQIQQ